MFITVDTNIKRFMYKDSEKQTHKPIEFKISSL